MSLFVVGCVLFYGLLIVSLLFVACCLLRYDCWLFIIVVVSFVVVRGLLFVVCRSLFVLWFVARMLLGVVGCVLLLCVAVCLLIVDGCDVY